jgi:hypothetical protein
MTFRPSLLERSVEETYASQLAADLSTGVRGGNKFRLIARCWVASRYGADCGMTADQYETFRARWEKQTFARIHSTFDAVLPVQFRSAAARRAATATAPRAARELSKKAEKLAASFARTSELTDAERAWIVDQGGVEALDGRKLRLVSGRLAGRCFTVLDGSWHGTAQAIRKLIAGAAELI